MTLCDAISLFIGIYGAFFGLSGHTKEWLADKYPIQLAKLNKFVLDIEKCRKADQTKPGENCRNLEWWIELHSKISRIALIVPTLVFALCMVGCAGASLLFFDDFATSSPPPWMKPVYQYSMLVFVPTTAVCLILSWVFRAFAWSHWKELRQHADWAKTHPDIADGEDNYASIKAVESDKIDKSPPAPAPAKPKPKPRRRQRG